MNLYERITELEAENLKLKEKIYQIENDEAYKQLCLYRATMIEVENKKRRQSFQDTFIKKLVEKKIPVSFARGRAVESEDQIETMLSDAEKEYLENKSSEN